MSLPVMNYYKNAIFFQVSCNQIYLSQKRNFFQQLNENTCGCAIYLPQRNRSLCAIPNTKAVVTKLMLTFTRVKVHHICKNFKITVISMISTNFFIRRAGYSVVMLIACCCCCYCYYPTPFLGQDHGGRLWIPRSNTPRPGAEVVYKKELSRQRPSGTKSL